MDTTIERKSTKSKAKTLTIVAVTQVAIALSFAMLYYLACTYTPELSLPFQFAGKASVRFGTMLRAFGLISPAASIGTTIGAGWYATSAASASIFFIPARWVAALAGITIYFISKKWGRSTAKDLTLLAGAGFVSGLASAIKFLALGAIMGGALGNAVDAAAAWKVVTTVVMTMAGYPLVLLVEGGIRRVRHG